MKKILDCFLVFGLLFASCSKLDNYEAPNLSIGGVVVDIQTGENIQTRQPNGIKIRMLEQRYINSVPIDFWCKSDGSFRNVRLFPGAYKVIPVEGPFEQASVDTLLVDMGNAQKISFKVEPYARVIGASIVKSGSGLKANYKISQGNSAKKILKSMLICYSSPVLHEATTGKLSSVENDLSGFSIDDIKSMSFEDVIDNVPSGQLIYSRIAVQTDNPLNRYNYSPIFEIQF